MKKWLNIALVAAAVSTVAAQSTPGTIVDVASSNSDFSTLVAAVSAADLVGTLSGTGPFTVFAPTNAAFAKLPAGTVDTLLKPENKAQLVSVLTYHVVSGKVMAADVVKLNGRSVATVQGATVRISVNGGNVRVNNANVTATDIAASNGVIHVIDSVLLPPAK
ncbi:MAG: fasciclin domain-containing protein [Pleurocapsa sp. SU_196_0]|nr:fasciclin domain-containing protein [Pleurocapsa sp. SU_196_0]